MGDNKPKFKDWKPAPGFVLCLPKKREDLQTSKSGLSMPDSVGKVSDSVGVGEVVKCGKIRTTFYNNQDKANNITEWSGEKLEPGDLIAWMPYTDTIIQIDTKKYSLVPYDKIRAVRRAN